jgi:fructoselysine and glucoselysine-specific PTS system IIA component
MRKYLIASHGTLASGIRSSLEIIIGSLENVFIIEAYLGENKSLEDEIGSVLLHINNDDDLIIFTDLMGGSVTNQILQHALKQNVYIISGFNLPLLLDILLADPETPLVEVIETGIKNAKDQIVYINNLLTTDNTN